MAKENSYGLGSIIEDDYFTCRNRLNWIAQEIKKYVVEDLMKEPKLVEKKTEFERMLKTLESYQLRIMSIKRDDERWRDEYYEILHDLNDIGLKIMEYYRQLAE